MALRIEIDCYCEYKCTCKPIPETKVTKQEIAYNLIRCNPALAKYFSKTLSYTETLIDLKETRKDSPKPYKSIVEQKNMNILLSDKYPAPVQQPPSQRDDILQVQVNNFVETYAQTSPRSQRQGKKLKQQPKKDPTQEEIKEYYRQLKQTSRYLPNTAFKKYFNRPIFQNYGRENTKGSNDGIIYGNYLKTHNINPHLGDNKPHDEETFYHALISASPQKFLGHRTSNLLEAQKAKTLSLTRLKQDESLQKPLKKHQNNEKMIIMDSIHQHNKLSQLSKSKEKLKSHLSGKAIKFTPDKSINKLSPIKQSISPRNHQMNTPKKILSQYVNQKQHIEPVRPQKKMQDHKVVSPRSHQNQGVQAKVKFQQNQMNNLSTSRHVEIQGLKDEKQYEKCPVDRIRESKMSHILSKNCQQKKSANTLKQPQNRKSSMKKIEKMDFGPGSPKHCMCKASNGQGICQQLKNKAQNDVDLSNRLIASARKVALYKNYELNSGQKAKLNPHNYTNCCGQIYTK